MMKFKSLDYTPYEEGMADTWIGGEPSEAATVIFADHPSNYPDNVAAWLNIDCRPETQNAYAKLFAAAPDLLAACEAFLKCPPRDRHDMHLEEIIRAAIQKAKGE